MSYRVTANLDDGKGDYLAHWIGGVFDDADEAIKFWEGWMPPRDEVEALVEEAIEEFGNDPDDFCLQIGVWDENGNDIRFSCCWY